MIKKIKCSLFAQVFLITTILLLCVSLLIYGALAFFMPQTYSNELNSALDQQSQLFVDELTQSTKQDSGGLFDQFLQNDSISYIELYTDDGQQVSLPTNTEKSSATGTASENAGGTSDYAPVLSSSYYFSFANENTRYMVIVYGSAAQVAELQQTFLRVLPILLCIILIVALAASWLYSRMITKPVLKISRISKQMSDLELEWRLEEQRSDELGTLEKSLNALSQKLSSTLSELQAANKQLEKDITHEKELEQVRLNFFSAASHELKTPITIIKGQLEGMILGVGVYKDHEKYLARSLEVANNLETMVGEILTISKLETASADFRIEELNCVAIVQSYLAETEDLIAQKELEICLDLPQRTKINGNRFLMEKVFSNLIGNAIKYSPPGEYIHIAILEKDQSMGFSIENTGIYISEDDKEKLFDAFYRVDPSRSKKTGGSGLGLYIVQKALEQHGSCCSVCNTTAGVQFSFTLKK